MSIKTALQCALLGVSVLLLAGCQLLKSDSHVEKMAALEPIKAHIAVKRLWQEKIGTGVDDVARRLQPVVAGGTVFVADEQGQVTAVVLATGQRLWQTTLKTEIGSGVGFGQGHVYVGTADGTIIALSAANGKVIWRQPLAHSILTPVVTEGERVALQTSDGKVYMLQAKTGSVLWRYDGHTPKLTLYGTSRPLFAGASLMVGFADGRVAALGLRHGRVLWSRAVAEPEGWSDIQRLVDINAPLLKAQNIIFAAAYQGNVVALRAKTGQTIWQRKISSNTGMALLGEQLIVTDVDGGIWALNRHTGETYWHQKQLQHRGVTAPAIFAGRIVVADAQGYVHWLAADDGRFVARQRVDGQGINVPAVATRDRLLVVSQSGRAATFNIAAQG